MTSRVKKLSIALFICVGILSGLLFPAEAVHAQNPKQEYRQNVRKFRTFYKNLNRYYVDKLNHEDLIDTAIESVLRELDPYSSYYTAAQTQTMDYLFGDTRMAGIGITVTIVRDTVVVLDVQRNKPAHKAGMRGNDRIISVGGKSVVGIDVEELADILKGKDGDKRVFDVLHEGGEQVSELIVTYRNRTDKAVTSSYKTSEGIGYIKLAVFSATAYEEFVKAYERLEDINGLIVDLRGNGGGALDKAILISSLFLPNESLVVYTEGLHTGRKNYYSKGRSGMIKVPLAVLIDHKSASASEIFAGTIQDWDRGIIVGQSSYGKGLAQRQFRFSDGSSTGIVYSRVHTPSGRCVQRAYDDGDLTANKADHERSRTDKAYADSLIAAAPVYRTLKYGRTVVGDNGIVPDVYVEPYPGADPVILSLLDNDVLMNMTANGLISDNMDSASGGLADADIFIDDFRIGNVSIDELIERARYLGVEIPSELSDESRQAIKRKLENMIAGKLCGEAEYIKVANGNLDPVFGRAVGLLIRTEDYEKILVE